MNLIRLCGDYQLITEIVQGDPMPDDPKPHVFRVYSMRFCPFAQRALLYLARKGIKAEVVNIDLSNKPDWYFKKHPQGNLPTLEHDGKIIIESTVIVQYLDELFPETSVLPTDPYERAQHRILYEQVSPVNEMISSPYGMLWGDDERIHLQFVSKYYGWMFPKGDDRKAKGEELKKEMDKAENFLKHKYFGSDQAGFVDYMIFPFYLRLSFFAGQPGIEFLEKQGFPGQKCYPRLSEWFKNMNALPEVLGVQPPPEWIEKFMNGYANGISECDLGL
ncbi:unnamed protein product [Anisakis simplex]|uniref:Glutathione S-transferase omega n=1 Tax=Anisakis simplex TaxID=6269 RepID=A0A0M3KBE2_ANISI|nr:unnamed protein product [Anisakis simplex]